MQGFLKELEEYVARYGKNGDNSFECAGLTIENGSLTDYKFYRYFKRGQRQKKLTLSEDDEKLYLRVMDSLIKSDERTADLEVFDVSRTKKEGCFRLLFKTKLEKKDEKLPFQIGVEADKDGKVTSIKSYYHKNEKISHKAPREEEETLLLENGYRLFMTGYNIELQESFERDRPEKAGYKREGFEKERPEKEGLERDREKIRLLDFAVGEMELEKLVNVPGIKFEKKKYYIESFSGTCNALKGKALIEHEKNLWGSLGIKIPEVYQDEYLKKYDELSLYIKGLAITASPGNVNKIIRAYLMPLI